VNLLKLTPKNQPNIEYSGIWNISEYKSFHADLSAISICEKCQGTGSVPVACPDCKGTGGQMMGLPPSDPNPMGEWVPCPTCGGRKEPCNSCDGNGYTDKLLQFSREVILKTKDLATVMAPPSDTTRTGCAAIFVALFILSTGVASLICSGG
jgi:hypothetical protein